MLKHSVPTVRYPPIRTSSVNGTQRNRIYAFCHICCEMKAHDSGRCFCYVVWNPRARIKEHACLNLTHLATTSASTSSLSFLLKAQVHEVHLRDVQSEVRVSDIPHIVPVTDP